jgi:hypothetical protein
MWGWKPGRNPKLQANYLKNTFKYQINNKQWIIFAVAKRITVINNIIVNLPHENICYFNNLCISESDGFRF